MSSQTWIYPEMHQCAGNLDSLRDRSNKNKLFMDGAFEKLVVGMQAETGAAFLSAYSEHIPSIELFAQILEAEAELLRSNANVMEEEDARIAAEIRSIFGV